MTPDEIKSLIERRRRQMLVHSYIYYEMNDNIVTDDQWSAWAKQLYHLQKRYPEIAKEAALAADFEDFDFSTGCNLNYRQPWVQATAEMLVDYDRTHRR